MNQPLEPSKSELTNPSSRPTWVRWEIVGLLMLISFMSWFNRVSFSVADKPIMKQFSLESAQIGVIDSALLFAYTLCMTPGGWIIDRKGPRAALLLMGFGSALFVAATGLVGIVLAQASPTQMIITGLSLPFLAFVAIRALMGCFSAPIYPACAKMVSHWIPVAQRAWANGLITGAAPVGMAVAHVVFGYLSDTFSWENAFLITGTATALLALLWSMRAKDYPAEHRRVNDAERKHIDWAASVGSAVDPGLQRPSRWWILLRNRSLVLLTLSYAAVGYFEYLFNFCGEYYFKGVLDIPEEVSRRYASYTSLAQAAAMPLGGLLCDLLTRRLGYRGGRAAVPVLGMLASAGTLFAATLTTDTQWTLLWFVLANAAIGATEGAFWTTAIELGGRRGGTSAGIVNTGGNLGGSLAPAVTRGLGQWLGDWHPGFYVGSLVCLMGVVLWIWINPKERVQEDLL